MDELNGLGGVFWGYFWGFLTYMYAILMCERENFLLLEGEKLIHEDGLLREKR